jgi:hypothetical protein
MKRITFATALPLLLMLALGGCATTGTETGSAGSGKQLTPAYQIKPAPTTYAFEQVDEAQAGSSVIQKYTRGDDTLEDWDRLITTTYTKGKQTAAQAVALKAAALRQQCPPMSIATRQLAEGQYLMEFYDDACGQAPGYYSLQKFIQGQDGVYILAFDMKQAVYSEIEFKEWRKRVRSASLGVNPAIQISVPTE